MASETFANLYLGIIFAAVVYQFGLLYGGMWYTRQTTVQCPKCGVYISKYRIETHQCHPSLVGDEADGAGGGMPRRAYRR